MSHGIITATRRGFAYQDKYALLRLLQLISSGEQIVDFSVDKPFGANRSLDIEIIFEDAREVYEIKTGTTFKSVRDKLWEELLVLKSYDADDEFVKFIIIDPEMKTEILGNCSDISLIAEGKKNKTDKRTNEKMIDVATRCLRDIGIENFDSIDAFIAFIGKVKIIFGPTNDVDHENDIFSDLDDKICSEIQNIADKLNITSANWAIPENAIASELLEVVRLGSENRCNILKRIAIKLAKIFARRKCVGATTTDQERIKAEDDLRKQFEEIYNLKFEAEAENPMETPEGSSALT